MNWFICRELYVLSLLLHVAGEAQRDAKWGTESVVQWIRKYFAL